MKRLMTQAAWYAALGLLIATPARADFSACQSAVGTSVKVRIADLTTCILKGRNGASANGFLYVLRGASYGELGDVDDAFRDYSTAIVLIPKADFSYVFRGEIFANRGEWSNAQADFDTAIKYTTGGSNVPVSLAHKAWLFATWRNPEMRDGARAVTLALKAIKLRDNASNHDVLAAAYAEAGQFDSAMREESAAIGQVRGTTKDRELPGYKARLALYQKNTAYHTELPFPLISRVEL